MSSWTRKTAEGPSLTIEDSLETGNACVIEGSRHLHVLQPDRREAAQALAGDVWGVIPAAEAAAPDGALSLIADVLGTDDLGDVLPGVERLKREVTKLRKHRDELRQRISDNAHARLYEAAQPDRPEPVDPSEIAAGDRVEVVITGTVQGVGGGAVDLISDDSTGIGIIDNYSETTWRVLHAAEPEPDEAAVEALAKKLYAVKATRIGLERDWSEIGNADQLRHRTEALTLICDHGVYVEVPNAD